MRMPKEYFFDPLRYRGAKCWDDLNSHQIVKVCEIIGEGNDIPFQIERLIPVLMGIIKGRVIITFDDAIQLTDFVFKGAKRTKAPFAKIKTGVFKKALYPPANQLSNISFSEFITADSAMMAFSKKGDLAQLDRLCACLYRQKKSSKELNARDYNGDVREPFNSNTLDRRTVFFKKIAIAEKMAILTYFAGCKAAMADKFTHIFKKEEKPTAGGFSWLQAMHVFTDNITQYQSVLDTRANLVMFEMDQSAKDAKERNDELEAIKHRR